MEHPENLTFYISEVYCDELCKCGEMMQLVYGDTGIPDVRAVYRRCMKCHNTATATVSEHYEYCKWNEATKQWPY